MLNKLIKAVSYFVVHLFVAVELYLLALLITSPLFIYEEIRTYDLRTDFKRKHK